MRRALVVAASVLVLTGCGQDAPAPTPAVGDDPTVRPEPATGLQVRPVLGPAQGGRCDDSGDPQLPGNPPADQEAVLCDVSGEAVRLGPAAVVGGVERVRTSPSRLPGTGMRVMGVRLEQDAARSLAELVSNVASSDSRLAIVLDGIVLNAPTAASTVGGRLLMVSGRFSQEQIERYAALLAP